MDVLVIMSNECITVINDGCNQYIVNINSFLIESFAGVMFSVGGSLHSMAASRLELVHNASTLVTLPSGDKVIFVTPTRSIVWCCSG